MDRDGDFEEFYSSSYRPLLRALVPLMTDVHAAEEVAQEAFLRAYRDWPRLSSYDDPRGWLYRVAMRLAISRWRRLRSAAAALVRYGPPAPVEPPDEISVAVFAALRRLPLAQRQVLVMHHMLDLPIPQIAAELGLPAGTVKARLFRGRAGQRSRRCSLMLRWWLVVDDITALLDRAVAPRLSSVALPPVAVIEEAARRHQLRRSLLSLTVVVLLVIGCVVGLASTGHASVTGPVGASAAAAANAPGGLR